MNAAVSLLVAFCVSVLTATGLGFLPGGLNRGAAIASLVTGVIAGAAQFITLQRRRGPKPPPEKIGGWGWAAITVYTLFSLRVFCWLAYWNEDKLQFISSNNLGDLSLHITYINNLASGVRFWPQNPIFAGQGIHYPIGVDLFNSLLKFAGIEVCHGLVLVGLAGCLVTGIALYKWGRGFVIMGFLCNGGLAGFQFFTSHQLLDYQTTVAWKSIPLALFVTQRGLLYAIPAGLALLWSWRVRYFPEKEGADSQKPLPFVTELLLYSTMPLFHLHTFIFLSFLLGCWMVIALVTESSILKAGSPVSLLKLVLSSVIPATVLMHFLTGGFKSASMIHMVWNPDYASKSWDWEYAEQPQFMAWSQTLHVKASIAPAFGHVAGWLVNYGALPFFVLTLVYAIFLRRKESSSSRAASFVIPAILMFLIACVVMFAQWDWDNTKIMIWCYLAVLPFLWDQLLAREHVILRAVCCFMLYFSGFITLLGGIDDTHTGYDLASRYELDEVARAVRPLPATAVFAGCPTYNHPLLLDGRIMVEGYEGHLISHGIDYKSNHEKLESLLNGEPGWQETARQLHARYLYWGKLEEDAYPDSAKPWETECLKIADGDFGRIYDLEAPAPPKTDPPAQ